MIVPEVPTLAESGLPGFDFSTWWGLFAPAGTPRPVIERLNHETLKALQLPDLKEKLTGVGADPAGNTPDEFAAFIRSETEKWGRVIRTGKISLE